MRLTATRLVPRLLLRFLAWCLGKKTRTVWLCLAGKHELTEEEKEMEVFKRMDTCGRCLDGWIQEYKEAHK